MRIREGLTSHHLDVDFHVMIISHPAVEGKADFGRFLMMIFTEFKFCWTVQRSHGLQMDCPVVGGCSPEIGLHPLGPPRGPQVGCYGAEAAQHPDRGCLQAPPEGVVETHGFTDQMCLRAGEIFPACASLISKF